MLITILTVMAVLFVIRVVFNFAVFAALMLSSKKA